MSELNTFSSNFQRKLIIGPRKKSDLIYMAKVRALVLRLNIVSEVHF